MSPILRLPQEIYDEILDRAKGCLQTMKSCTLVCRDWLPRARTYLFYDFTFPPRSYLDLAQLEGCPEEAMEELQVLIDDMNASTLAPSLSAIVRRLCIYTEWLISISRYPTLFSQLPFKCLTHFRVRAFNQRPYDRGGYWFHGYTVDAKPLSQFLAQQPLLEHLFFEHLIYFTARIGFFELLHNTASSAAKLHTLCIDGVFCMMNSLNELDQGHIEKLVASFPIIKNPPPLRVLKFSPGSFLAEHLAHFFDISSLHTLVITSVNLASLRDLMLVHGRWTITSLVMNITIDDYSSINDLQEAFNGLVNVLRLELILSEDHYSHRLRDFFIIGLPRLRNLCDFTLTITKVQWIPTLPFFNESLDASLSALPDTTNPRLEAIVFYLPADEKEMAESVMACLPKTQGRGLLEIRLGRESDPCEI
ncbi:hypothetical protein VKT23_015957 [Stygiomarasmius scandens]|uniref:F-box domain-containing protein n=1 Tax=Marasmiellus scandens TaxID=2682957 RepID=A0ABR1IVZ5_9AGAR